MVSSLCCAYDSTRAHVGFDHMVLVSQRMAAKRNKGRTYASTFFLHVCCPGLQGIFSSITTRHYSDSWWFRRMVVGRYHQLCSKSRLGWSISSSSALQLQSRRQPEEPRRTKVPLYMCSAGRVGWNGLPSSRVDSVACLASFSTCNRKMPTSPF